MTSFAAGDAGTTSSDAVIYALDDECTVEDVTEGNRYLATVNGVVEYGVFVDLSDHVSGLVHASNLTGSYDVGDELVVKLLEIRENGDIGFAEETDVEDLPVEHVQRGVKSTVEELTAQIGETVYIDGQVVQINQTGGPTIFSIGDGTGVIQCAAFEAAGVRAFPNVSLDDTVRVTGTVERHNGAIQLEVDSIATLRGAAATEVQERVESRIETRADAASISPLIEWPAIEKLFTGLESIAFELRRAVLESRPIRLRHHADVDGMCASLPVQIALENFISEVHTDPAAGRHLLKRLPSKAPYYELEDLTRDLNYALEDRARFGQQLPLLFMIDNGSTEEDVPAYRALSQYDIPIHVVDHHHPDEHAVEPYIETHVNPYLHGQDYRITTGMLCVELARMIDPSITDDISHVPAVAGLADRSKANAMAEYLDLAEAAGYDRPIVENIVEALDYAAHWLRYRSGRNLIHDIIDVNCNDPERHSALITFLSKRAREDVTHQLDIADQHVEHSTLPNGAHLYQLDVENHTRRFTYPAPGKTTGELHDRMVLETGDPVITIGYGPDFAVLRSDGVRLDIPEMVDELEAELAGTGVSGGGHLVVGSIKFVSGRRREVLDALIDKMGNAAIDEGLGSTLTQDD